MTKHIALREYIADVWPERWISHQQGLEFLVDILHSHVSHYRFTLDELSEFLSLIHPKRPDRIHGSTIHSVQLVKLLNKMVDKGYISSTTTNGETVWHGREP